MDDKTRRQIMEALFKKGYSSSEIYRMTDTQLQQAALMTQNSGPVANPTVPTVSSSSSGLSSGSSTSTMTKASQSSLNINEEFDKAGLQDYKNKYTSTQKLYIAKMLKEGRVTSGDMLYLLAKDLLPVNKLGTVYNYVHNGKNINDAINMLPYADKLDYKGDPNSDKWWYNPATGAVEPNPLFEPEPVTTGPIISSEDGYLYQVDSDGNYIYLGQDPDYVSPYQQSMADLQWAELERQKSIDEQNQANWLKEYNQNQANWLKEYKWDLAQSPDEAMPTGFAGYNQQYNWSPNAEINTGQGWINAPMSYQDRNDPNLYGSGAWSELGQNWYDVSRIDRNLYNEGRTDEGMNYLTPGVVASYIQGIEPWQLARNVEYQQAGGNPYQMSATPGYDQWMRMTSNQQNQLLAGIENLHTTYGNDPNSIENFMKDIYMTRPSERREPILYY